MLGPLALIVIAGTAYNWIQLVDRVAVPRDRRGWFAVFLAGGALGVAAIAQGGFFNVLFGIPAAAIGFLFPALRLQSTQQPNRPAVGVGDPMMTFVAPDEHGTDFDLASLLIALLRSAGFPARYAVGLIETSAAATTSWLGVDDPDVAASIFDESLTLATIVLPHEHPFVVENRMLLGLCQARTGEHVAAEGNFLLAYNAIDATAPGGGVRRRDAAWHLAGLYEALGRAEEAAAWRARAGR